MNKYLIILIMAILCSCGEDWAFKEETLYIAAENRDWITPDKYGTSFIMVDNNKISQGFMMNENSTDLSPKTSSYFGIRTRISKYESFTQGWSSNFGQRFGITLQAGFEPFGDRLGIGIDRIYFSYDFKFKTIASISLNSSDLSKTMTDKGYEENEKICSTVEILDSLTVNGVNYDGILHFSLEDFKDIWSDFTIKEVFIGKHIGLVKYSLKNGITYER